MRSLTKFGLSQITLQFADGTDIYRARQLVAERLQNAIEQLPPGTTPKLAPIILSAARAHLDIWNAASSPYTLKVMTIVALIFVPIILAYQGYTYWVFRKRVSTEKKNLVY